MILFAHAGEGEVGNFLCAEGFGGQGSEENGANRKMVQRILTSNGKNLRVPQCIPHFLPQWFFFKNVAVTQIFSNHSLVLNAHLNFACLVEWSDE